MSFRAPREAVEQTDYSLSSEPVAMDWLADVLRDAAQALPIRVLAREAVRATMVAGGQLRVYAAGRSYDQGERVRLLDGRIGDVISVERGGNVTQGSFKIVSVKLLDGEVVRLAAEVSGAPETAAPELVNDAMVARVWAGREDTFVRKVRQAIASDPRFVTLYYSDEEYGCLREFFPAMSPDVLDAALALLLDGLFDQVPVARITEESTADREAYPSESAPAGTLFSTNHVDGALLVRPELDGAAREAFESVRSLWARAEQYGHGWTPAQMSHAFFQPLLRALGWSSVPFSSVAGDSNGLYALCADEVAAAQLLMQPEDEAPLAPWALAAAQMGAWMQPLDLPPSGERVAASEALEKEKSIPVALSHQMIGGLRRTGVRWGILTNGAVWRLVSRGANSLSRTFYEVDLSRVFVGLGPDESLGPERWRSFKHWWLLFRQASYLRDNSGLCLLERLGDPPRSGDGGAREILRERLLSEVLPAIAQGFVSYRRARAGVDEESAASLRAILRGSALLITRILFVLAAEGRRLLPLDDTRYRPHSLTAQAEWARQRISKGLGVGEGVYTTPRYDLVLALLQRIARGDAEIGIPRYGRLFFDPMGQDGHEFLERFRLSDRALAEALDGLTRGMDYTALDAYDLAGALGILSRVRLAWPAAEADEVMVVYQGASGGRLERLPDYVVTSSVEQALAPVLEVRGERFEEAMDRVVALRRRLRRTLDRRRRASLYAEWEAAARQARQAFLGLRVCDPAMGTGSFLLGTVDALTDGILDQLQRYHRANKAVSRDWNPIYRLVDEVRQDVREELVRQVGERDAPVLDDATILSRLVAQKCLFGVAADATAVEVAQVSLWLQTFGKGAPVSFLVHHLRHGNALLGMEFAEVAHERRFASLTDEMTDAVAGGLYPIAERVDRTPLDVRWSAGQSQKTREAIAPHQVLLDLMLSAALGDTEARETLSAANRMPRLEILRTVVPAWLEAQADAEGFFHWELEFPELFVDLATAELRDDPGVDLVIGNPPWLPAPDETLARFYASRFGGSDCDGFNPHHAFLALARWLTGASGGRTAYVLSRAWLAEPTGGI